MNKLLQFRVQDGARLAAIFRRRGAKLKLTACPHLRHAPLQAVFVNQVAQALCNATCNVQHLFILEFRDKPGPLGPQKPCVDELDK